VVEGEGGEGGESSTLSIPSQPRRFDQKEQPEPEEEEIDIFLFSPRVRNTRRVYSDGTSHPPAPPVATGPQHTMDVFRKKEQEVPTETPEVSIECSLFISCAERDIDSNLFYALNENSIVYDGRLTVNERWATNDPQIFGAGSVAVFSRSCQFPHSLDRYNGRECGQFVGAYLRENAEDIMSQLESSLTGTFRPLEQTSSTARAPVVVAKRGRYASKQEEIAAAARVAAPLPSMFLQAVTEFCYLPDGRLFFRSRIPGFSKGRELVKAEKAKEAGARIARCRSENRVPDRETALLAKLSSNVVCVPLPALPHAFSLLLLLFFSPLSPSLSPFCSATSSSTSTATA
jgi:hypothetical protein